MLCPFSGAAADIGPRFGATLQTEPRETARERSSQLLSLSGYLSASAPSHSAVTPQAASAEVRLSYNDRQRGKSDPVPAQSQKFIDQPSHR